MGKTYRLCIVQTVHWKHPHGRGEDVIEPYIAADDMETPPRAWGRRGFFALHPSFVRNTPTGVGKTVTTAALPTTSEKHPHGRGEDCEQSHVLSYLKETPPRAWGRHHKTLQKFLYHRNTPTGVGKTASIVINIMPLEKHPHGRGEDRANSREPVYEKKHPHGRGEDLSLSAIL